MLKLRVVRTGSVPPSHAGATGRRIHVWRDHEGAVCAFGGSRDGGHWMRLPNVACFYFGDTGDEVRAFVDPKAAPESIVDAYHRSVLPMALQALDTEVLHASAVSTPFGVIALCAVSGTGKSTLAVGLSRRGYPVWGDDAVAFKTSPSLAEAIPLPFAIRLRPEAAALLGSHPEAPGSPAPDGGNGEQRRRKPLAALCVLERMPTRQTPITVERLLPPSAFPAVLAHAYCFNLDDPARKRRMVEEYLQLTAIVPTFRIRFEPGLERLDAVLDGIESVLATEPACRT
jgi:hypothetical protein